MRAIVADGTGGPEVLREAELPVPEPGLGEVLVRVHAAELEQGRGFGKTVLLP